MTSYDVIVTLVWLYSIIWTAVLIIALLAFSGLLDKMKISISNLGTTELPALGENDLIKITDVRLRQTYLKRRLDELPALIRHHSIMSDMDLVKELKEEQAELTKKIKLLSQIRSQADRSVYDSYIETYCES